MNEISPLEMNEVEWLLTRAECHRCQTVTLSTELLRRLMDENKRLHALLQEPSATDEDDDEWVDDDDDPWMEGECDRCGGDGHLELSEAPELWGEDVMTEKNRLVTCPDCDGTGKENL